MHKPLAEPHQNLDQLFAAAFRNHQNGHLVAAEEGYRRLLAAVPANAVLHYNLGLVKFHQGEPDEACRCFSRAAELAPEDGDILFNLALSRKQCGDLSGAVAAYRQVLATNPDCLDTLYNLAGCHKESGDHQAAVELYREVVQRAPDHHPALSNLAYLYHRFGQREEAIAAYRRVLLLRPDHVAAGHMLAALSGQSADSPPESYVREVFDNYSGYFEKSVLDELGYCVPEKLLALYLRRGGGKAVRRHGLDLGCGTGLGGQAFADRVERLDGLDLSAKMLALAQHKGVYHRLHQQGIGAFLAATEECFDFYLATDVFPYLGDLGDIFTWLTRRAMAGAVLLFSSENLMAESYRLQETGRFAHSVPYIEGLAAANGWNLISHEEAELRRERDTWVAGDLWYFRLP